jgi:hypothetical protein
MSAGDYYDPYAGPGDYDELVDSEAYEDCATEGHVPLNAQEESILRYTARLWEARDKALEQLTIVQARCSELLEENRKLRRHCETMSSALDDVVAAFLEVR